ncbi:MAG: hypothetical protein IJP96_07010 [Synergistaceae bacterium]|nr:hypothetical protein [Synergistaceae bacterium]
MSGIRRNGGGAAAPPVGLTYDQFMQMSNDEKYDLMDKIIKDENIKVPDYLDDSITTKVMYALGMNNKPTVVSDSELDKLPGDDLYRAIYDSTDFNLSSKDIMEQLKYSNYTQLSGKGGSVYGRGIYFTNDFTDAAEYGSYGNNMLVMRAKINPNSKMSTLNEIQNKINKDLSFGRIFTSSINDDDKPALYAIAHGIDGWNAKTNYPSIFGEQNVIHTAVINRKSLIFSSSNKSGRNKDDSDFSFSWVDAKDV